MILKPPLVKPLLMRRRALHPLIQMELDFAHGFPIKTTLALALLPSVDTGLNLIVPPSKIANGSEVLEAAQEVASQAADKVHHANTVPVGAVQAPIHALNKQHNRLVKPRITATTRHFLGDLRTASVALTILAPVLPRLSVPVVPPAAWIRSLEVAQ